MSNPRQVLTTQDERSMAMASHLLSAFTGFIGPLVIYILKRDSLFVRFHALQGLIWHAFYFVISMIFGVLWFVFIFSTIFASAGAGRHGGPPPPLFFVFMPVLWLGIMFLWVVNVIVGVMGALKSNDGHWWRYPIAGRLAEKFLEVEG